MRTARPVSPEKKRMLKESAPRKERKHKHRARCRAGRTLLIVAERNFFFQVDWKEGVWPCLACSRKVLRLKQEFSKRGHVRRLSKDPRTMPQTVCARRGGWDRAGEVAAGAAHRAQKRYLGSVGLFRILRRILISVKTPAGGSFLKKKLSCERRYSPPPVARPPWRGAPLPQLSVSPIVSRR